MLHTLLAASVSATKPTLEFVGSASSTTSTINISSITEADSLCVLVDHTFNNATPRPSEVIPSGFTKIADPNRQFTGGPGFRHILSYKILAGTEGTLTGMSGDVTRKYALVFRFIDNDITNATLGDVSQSIGGGTRSVSTAGQISPLVIIGSVGKTGVPASFTNNLSPMDGVVPASSDYAAIFYKIVNTGTQSATLSDTGNITAMVACFINVS